MSPEDQRSFHRSFIEVGGDRRRHGFKIFQRAKVARSVRLRVVKTGIIKLLNVRIGQGGESGGGAVVIDGRAVAVTPNDQRARAIAGRFDRFDEDGGYLSIGRRNDAAFNARLDEILAIARQRRTVAIDVEFKRPVSAFDEQLAAMKFGAVFSGRVKTCALDRIEAARAGEDAIVNDLRASDGD
ncbi:MAG: hypothetical protein AAGJ87_09490 [Pseudomonadota bacterium]